MREVTAFACDFCSYVDTDTRSMIWHEKDHQRELERRAKRESTGQLTIGQIIQKCKALPDLPVVISCDHDYYDGSYPSELDSYRGYYDELAIDISRDKAISLSFFLKDMIFSLHNTYSGYKGGEYSMHENTFVWLAKYGSSSGLAITDVCLSPGGETVHVVATRIEEEL